MDASSGILLGGFVGMGVTTTLYYLALVRDRKARREAWKREVAAAGCARCAATDAAMAPLKALGDITLTGVTFYGGNRDVLSALGQTIRAVNRIPDREKPQVRA